MTAATPPADPNDPVLKKRARIATMVGAGKRIGYLLFLAALVLFFIGFATEYSSPLTTSIVACILVGSFVLAPSIVFGYAVRAADREDMGLPSGH